MDVNEAAKEYSGKESHPLNNAFIAGAKWQEEHSKCEMFEDLEEELKEWMEYGPHTNFPWCTIPDAIEITARHFADWQKAKDYKMYAHVSLRNIHDAWQELIKNNPDIRNTPAVCFARGADWQKEQDKETIEVAEDHAMFAGMNMVLDNPEKYGLQKINKDGTLQNS